VRCPRGVWESGVAVKPSDAIAEAADKWVDDNPRAPDGPASNSLAFAILDWLDEEAERRAKFEADVLERINRLECTTEPPPAFEVRSGQTVPLNLEAIAPPPEELDPTKPLYVGDGAPAVKRYEPEPEGSEEL
jgi:hypothetical protein